jgi:hypothetical protein
MQTDERTEPRGLLIWWAEMSEHERQEALALAGEAFGREVTPLEAMLFLITGHRIADPDSNIIDMRDEFRRFARRTAD